MHDTRKLQDLHYRRLTCAVMILLLIPLGLLCRFVPLGLPGVVVKYGGSFLWAATVYWSIAFIAARQKPSLIAAIAACVSALVEFIKRIESPGLDAFRSAFVGKVLRGRHFSYLDILVYWCAILCAISIDRSAIQGRRASKE